MKYNYLKIENKLSGTTFSRLKSLVTFVVGLLFCFSVFATPPSTITVPTSTLTLPDLDTWTTWNGTIDNPYIIKNDTIIFNANEVYQTAKKAGTPQPWLSYTGGGTSSGDWAAMGSFAGSSEWKKAGASVNTYVTVKSETDRIHYYRVTNCIGALALVKSGSNKRRTIYLEAYEVSAGVATTPAVKSASMESSTMGIISIDGLDETKDYVITIYANGTGSGGSSPGNSNLYEFALVYKSSGPFAVNYNANGGTGTMTDASSPYVKDATVTVLSNSFTAPSGMTFSHWNTKADGTGTSYDAGDTFAATAVTTLYAQWAYPPTGTATITYTLTRQSDAVTGAVSGVSTISGLSTEFTASTLTINTTGSGKDNYSGRVESIPADYSASTYLDLEFAVATGYAFTPTSVTVQINPFTSSAAEKAKVELLNGTLSVVSEELALEKSTDNSITFSVGAFTGKEFTGTTHLRIYLYGASGNNCYIKSPVTITGVVTAAGGGATYAVTYDANGGTGSMTDISSPYSAGASVTVLSNSFTAPATGSFSHWNTAADGSGTSYDPGDTFSATEDVTLYAQWLYACAPTVDASCKVDAWAPGIDYVKNAPATITWTTIATSSSGDDSKLRYKWYRYPVGYPALAEEAEGTNDQASFTPSSTDLHDWMEYYCRVTEVGCTGYDDTHVTGAIRVATTVTGWVAFEGESFDDLIASPVAYYPASGIPTHPGTIAYEKSSSSIVDVSGRTNSTGNGKSYTKGVQISKSTSGYFSFTIPDDYVATFTYAFAGTGNRTIILASEKINSTSASGYIATLTSTVTSSTIQGGSYTTPLDAGTYYICEGGTGNWIICELIFNLVSTDCTAPTNTSASFGGKDNYMVGDAPVLSFTASATPANGGAITYQWYQNTTGSKIGAVIADPDADGYNDRATYTPSTASPGTHFYYCVMREAGCAKTVETELSGIVTVSIPPTTGWILFDGEMHSEMQSSPVYYYDGTSLATSGVYMTYRTVGSLTAKDISTRTNDGNYKTYTTGIQTGGTTSSSNNYLEFTIPIGTRATSFSWAFGSTGNNRTIHLGTKPASVGDDIAVLCTFPASGGTTVILSGKYTSTLEAGTYYISSLDGGACLYVDLNFTLETTCTPPTNTSPTFGGKADYKIGDTPVLSFTASATPSNGGEINYQWYQNTVGSKIGAVIADPDADGYNNRATYTPATDKKGVHFYYCVMTESGCPLTVETALSGIVQVNGCDDEVIIDATLASNTSATMTGSIGGTADLNIPSTKDGSGGYKLGNNGNYFMITLASGNFEAGDVIKFNVTTESGSKKLYLYSSKSAAGKFAEISTDDVGTYSYTLTASDISTYSITNTIGTYRESSANNPFLKSISVERLVCYGCASVPTITAQPTGAEICSDATHTLSVTATGATSYQWYKDGTLQAGKTAASFSTAEAGEWYCQVYASEGCFARTSKVNVVVNTKVTAAWGTAPSNGKALDTPKHPTVTTNYAAGLAWSSTDATVAEVVWNDDDSRWDLVYKSEGDVTITATVTGADGYCGTATVSQLIHVDAPDCPAYSFNWGTGGSTDWEVTCFIQEGTSTTWLTPVFTVPTSTKQNYYVGYMGVWDTDDANSADGTFKDNMPFALSPSQGKIFGRAEAGNMGGAQGRLRIYSDSGDDNKYVGFVPAGYGMRIATATPQMLALAPQSDAWDEIDWRSELTTLTSDILAANYDVRLKTATDYVWAEAYSTTSAVAGMKVKALGDTWRATDLAAGDAGLVGTFAIYANSGDPNWYCYFIPYLSLTFDLNGGDSWSGIAPEGVAINGSDAARTVTIPADIPVRAGYKFVGWNTDKDALVAEYAPSANVILTADTKLYAIWREIVLLPLDCDDDFTGSEIAASGAFSGTHYEGGFSDNEKFYIIGDASKAATTGGTPEQKTASKVTINDIDFTEFIYLKGAATLDGSGIPTDRAIKFKIGEAGNLTIYFKDGKNIRLLKEGGEPVALAAVTGNNYGTYGVTAGTYYIYATAASTNIVGLKFECCPSVTPYAVSEKDGKTSMCPGDDATIRLANSQTGIAYQLFKDGVLVESSDKNGSDGVALEWAVTEPGTYTVKSAVAGCPATDMTGSVVITNPGANIAGDNTLMRTESIVLTADKIGGVWALKNPADAVKLELGTPDETDGLTSKLTVTGLKEGDVVVTYTLGGCATEHNITVAPYQICYSFASKGQTSPLTMTQDGVDLQIIRVTNTTGKLDLAESTAIIVDGTANYSGLYVISTYQRIALKTSVATKQIKLYAHYNSSTARTIKTVSWSTTGADKSYTAYTKGDVIDWNVDFDSDAARRFYEITIWAVDDNYIPKDTYIWIEYNGTGLQTREICIEPVDCSDLNVAVTGFTTLNVGESAKLSPTIAGGEWTNSNDDALTLTDNGDGTATVTAKSVGTLQTANVTYTLPNGCSVTKSFTVNADPCPEPTITLYTAADQTLGLEVPLILSATATAEKGTLTYQWFSNSTPTTEGGVPVNPTSSAAYNNHLTQTSDSEGVIYYYVVVTNSADGSSKSKASDLIKITTKLGCEERTIIKGVATGQNAGSIVEGEGTISVKQSSTTETFGGKTAWRLGSSGNYFMLTLPEGEYFQNGDIVRLTYLRGNGSGDHSIQLFKTNADDGILADHLIPNTSTTVALYEDDIILHGIAANTINSIGVRRTSAIAQNEAVYSIEVLRTYCYSNAPTCLNIGANFVACDVDPASGYSYSWTSKKAGDSPEAIGTSNVATVITTTEERTITCSIIKDAITQDNQTATISGDGTQFVFALGLDAYFKGMTDELVPVTYGGDWTITCSDETCDHSPCKSATVEYVGGKYIFTPLASNYTTVTLTYTNANGCSHSKTISASNPYFVFKANSGNRWATVGNWYVSTNSTTYVPREKESIPNCLPTIESRVIILDSCVVDIPNANAQYVRIAHGTAEPTVANGKLAIAPNGALTINSTLSKFEADGTKFGEQQRITVETDGIRKILRCDLYLYSDATGVGALSFINPDNMLPQAAVSYYFKSYYNRAAQKADWQYIGTPFSNSPSFLTMFYNGYIAEWTESGNHWIHLENTDSRTADSPEPFVGYAFTQAVNPAGYTNFHTGTLNPTKAITFDLECSLPPYGYNIFANSWTSPIYIGPEGALDFTGDVEKAVYVFATGDSITWAKYYKETVVNTLGPKDPEDIVDAMPGQYYSMPVYAAAYAGPSTIAPMQGFFVKANTPGAPATMTIDYAKAVQNVTQKSKSTSPRFAPARQKQQEVGVTTITLIGESAGDKLYVLTGKDEFTNGFDNGWDGRKIVSIAAGAPYLAVHTPAGKMHISAQPQLLGTTLSFRAGEDEYYDLIITTPEENLMLKDMELNITIPLSDTTIYSFFSTNNTTITSRFCIVQRTDIATSVDTEDGSLLNAFVSDDEIVITNFTGEQISGGIYDMAGKMIQSFNSNTEIIQLTAPAIRGVYLIKIGDRTFKLTI